MKKILIIGIFLFFVANSLSFETYDRKSISILKTDVKKATFDYAKKKYIDLIDKELYRSFRGLGRFDYNPIPAGVKDPEKLFEIVKEYAATKIEERAAKQWNIKNEYYGSNFVTGENVDKIINGTYLLFPSLDKLSIIETKDEEEKTYYKTNLEVSVAVYSAENKGTEANPNWVPKYLKTIKSKGSSYVKFVKKNASKKEYKSVQYAISTMLILMEKDLKKLDAFKIKSLVIKANPKKDRIVFQFGKNMGVKIDDAYVIGYHAKTKSGKKKFVETGYLKVRKVRADASEAQLLIVNNPKHEKEANLFNEYDTTIEYPLIGVNFIPHIALNGLTYVDDEVHFTSDYPDEDEEDDDLNEKNIVLGLGCDIEYDLAKLLQISELYLDFNIGYNLIPGIEYETKLANDEVVSIEENFYSLLIELGLKKKFFKRKFGFYGGTDLFYHSLTFKKEVSSERFASESEIRLYSLGMKFYGGFNYLLTKNVFLDFNTGFRLSGVLKENIIALDDETSDEDIPYKPFEKGKYYTPKDFFLSLGVGISI